MIKVDWDMIDEQYNYTAMDANGFWYIFINRPTINENDRVWKDASLSFEIPNDDAITFNNTKGVKDWKQTLVCRNKQEKDIREFTEENFVKYLDEFDCNDPNYWKNQKSFEAFKAWLNHKSKSSEELAAIELLKSLNYNVEKQ